MPAVFHITHVEATARFVLYHLDAAKEGASAIVSFRHAPTELEPTLAMLHRWGRGFDFEIDPHPVTEDDPRLRGACRIRALVMGHGRAREPRVPR
ncbi:MAG: hypothetical protein KC501_06345 [Myxococcales bacterium]|nr:hypothetical protein [Myxococcales bacterium]